VAVKIEAVNLVEFLTELMRLKALPRTGWLLRGIRNVESVADHLYGVTFIAMLLADCARARGLEVNVEKVLRMALLHDLSEARTGDLPATIKRYFPAESLKYADKQAASEILAKLGDLGTAYLALWHEYEERRTLEARLVKAADKLDLLFQAREYERGGANGLQEFWENAAADFSELDITELIGDLLAALSARWENND
jgi:putative hydrolases of HD superfamily